MFFIMSGLFSWCKAYISEILLILVSIAIIAGYCYGFDFLEVQWARVLLAVGVLVFEVIIMIVLNAFSEKPGESVPFMRIYSIAFVILMGVICAYSILYLTHPVIVTLSIFLLTVILFLFGFVYVVCHRASILFNKIVTAI